MSPHVPRLPFAARLPPAPTHRGSRTIQRIVEAAAGLFGREGYQGASMQAVARAAGVSKGLLHYHFQNKEHLLIEAQRATFRQVYRRFRERSRRGERGLPTALEALDALWDAVRDLHVWAPFMVETMSLAPQGGPVREHLDAFYAEAMDLLERGIHDVFEGETHRLAVPPHRLARMLRTTLHGLVVELAYARSPADLETIEATYRDMRDTFARVVYVDPDHPEVSP